MNGSYIDDLKAHSLERELVIRRQGKRKLEKAPLYPGYIFIETSCNPQLLRELIKPIHSAIHFLHSNNNIQALVSDEEAALRKMLDYGTVLPRSRVSLTPNQPITIIDGPLKGMEGIIQRIDRRRERVKVRMIMSEKPFTFDLGIEIVAAAEAKAGKTA